MSSAPITHEQWHIEHRDYMGGTDIAAVVLKHKYKTPLDVYFSKVEPKADTSSRMAEVGSALEPLIFRWVQEETQLKLEPSRTYRDPEFAFLGANPDAEIGDDELGEIKTYSFQTKDEWGEEGTDQVPDAYYIQAVFYCGITGRQRCHIFACDRATLKIRYYTVESDPENYALLKAAGIRFWNTHVLAKLPPAPGPKDADNIIRLYPQSTGEILISESPVDDLAMAMESLYQEFKPKEKRYRALLEEMKMHIGGAAGIDTIAGRFLVTEKRKTSWAKVAKEAGVNAAIIAKHTGKSRSISTPFTATEGTDDE